MGKPETTFVPTVVIYIEDGQVKLVQSDVPYTVYLVDYDVVSLESAVVLERSEYDCDPDYVYIDELQADVDAEAVGAIATLYLETFGYEDEDNVIPNGIRKG
jgi:hypothetical protein